ncbi:preprotein translocase subunit YajC [Ruminococcus sp.]|uniref:preprotein translocase subunit YajC n=1 Tax=Ruminococcus sp. TaxID=41978 RepID=UPI0025D69E37|nr:preprotein translocase subunit YajC [Ruminococcus sp.]
MMKKFAKLGLAASTAALTGSLCAVTAFAEGGSASANGAGGSGFGTVGYLIFMILLFAVMYFILIRPQKKKDKEAKAMQSSLQVGDEIVTIGGIVGLVVQVGEDTIVVETTGNRNKIRLKNWAIQENLTMTENTKREQEAKLAAAKAKKEEKANKKKKDDSDGDQGMLKD